MKFRVVEHTRSTDNKVWYTAEYRRFFFWIQVPGFVEGMKYDKTFSTEEDAWKYLKWYFKDETISKRVIY